MSEAIHEENEALHEVWLPLHEAAEALGISPRAVQLRAEKGKLQRERQDGRVVFYVADSRSVHVENEVKGEALHEESEAVHEASAAPDLVYVAHLETEVQFLRAQVETHQQNEAELRRLMLADKHELNALREKVQMLLAAPPVEEPPPTVQDVPVSPPEARTDTLETNAGISAQQLEQAKNRLETGIEVKRKTWWKFWEK